MPRDPRRRATQAAEAPADEDETAGKSPPALDGGRLQWQPVRREFVIQALDAVKLRDGWNRFGQGTTLIPCLIISNARALRTCEPRYDASAYPLRSTYAYFPDYQHPAGEWWQLEDKFDVRPPEHEQQMRLIIGYPISILVHVFEPLDPASTLKDSSKGAEAPPLSIPAAPAAAAARPLDVPLLAE
jgi:hypothetical protein